MIVEKLSNALDAKKYIKEIGVDGGGIDILYAKTQTHIISIKDLHVGGANILKQDALSVGADLAVPRGTVLALTPRVDCLLIATTSQLKKLAKKELAQPFGLKDLALKFKEFTQIQKPQKVRIMGIINANDDSFFSGSRFNDADAIAKIETMIEEGATIIDIGGVSSKPNAEVVSAEEELSRVKPIVDMLYEKQLYKKASFSIDSYEPKVIEYALQSGFTIVNDITGLANDEVCRVVAKYDAQVVIMHMQGTPQTMQKNPQYENILDDIYQFFQKRIDKAKHFGINDILLDIGIGFGKTLEDNLKLIKHLEHFRTLNKPLLVGASRKSMIHKIDESSVEERLAGTIALHLEAIRNGASIVRVHDVKEHHQAIAVYEELFKI